MATEKKSIKSVKKLEEEQMQNDLIKYMEQFKNNFKEEQLETLYKIELKTVQTSFYSLIRNQEDMLGRSLTPKEKENMMRMHYKEIEINMPNTIKY